MKTKFTIFLKILSIIILAAIAFSPKVLARSQSTDDTNTDLQAPNSSTVTSSEDLEKSNLNENFKIELESSYLEQTPEIDQDSHWAIFFNTDGQSEGDNRTGMSSGGSR
jgi:hypothetical protein